MARKRIRIADFRGEPAELEFPDGTVYLIRGDLPMEVVNFLGDFEERTGAGDVDEFDKWLTEGHDLIQKIVREGAEDQREVVLPSFSPQELLGIMGALVGGESVGAALADALSSGIGEAMREKAALEAAEAAAANPPQRPGRTSAKKKTSAVRTRTKA